LANLSESVLAGVVAEVGGVPIPAGAGLPSVAEALSSSGVVSSKAAGRRAIAEGGAYVNNRKVTDPDATLAEQDLLHGRYVILRRGKKTVGALAVGSTGGSSSASSGRLDQHASEA
jgi:tyrosyl-tRNA synthetase